MSEKTRKLVQKGLDQAKNKIFSKGPNLEKDQKLVDQLLDDSDVDTK